MLVNLAELKPNPMRDFIVDPIDRETVDTLKASIHEHGFWGGIACRQLVDGTIEIAAGHHRVKAALEEGVATADIFVRTKVDNAEMVRLYALENGTQRTTNSGTALAGTVASSLRFITKAILTEADQKFLISFDLDRLRRNLQSQDGLGQKVVTAFLHDVPGINDGIVMQQLANLKASGDYARILAEVEQEILVDHANELQRLADEEAAANAKREEDAARQAREDRAKAEKQHGTVHERAQRAATKAAETPKTFDFEGVARHFKNAHQIDAFRKAVTGPGIRPYLAVHDQAALAQAIVQKARERKNTEISAAFIKENVVHLLLASKDRVRALTQEEEAQLFRDDRAAKALALQERFLKHAYYMASQGVILQEFLRDDWPKTEPFPWKETFAQTVRNVKVIIDQLAGRL